MIQKPFYFLHSVAVVATEPKNDEMYGAEYQSLLWSAIHDHQLPGDRDTREVA